MDQVTAIPLDSAHPLLLNGSAGRWLIDAGGVDIFAVPLCDGVPAGAREHLCRLGPGQLLCGIGAAGAQAALALMAVGLPATQLRSVRASESAAQAGLFDDWLMALCSSLRRVRPRDLREAPDDSTPTAREEEAGPASSAVVWVEAPEAGLDWHPARHELAASPPFALTSTNLLQLRADGQLVCNSAALGDMLDDAVCGFYTALLDYLQQRRGFKEQAVSLRLQRKQQSDEQVFAHGLNGLAEVLAGAQEILHAEDSGAALLDACRMVMAASGIQVALKPLAQDDDQARQVEQLARQAHVALRRVRLSEANWWCTDSGPLLVFRVDDGRPLALLPERAQGYSLADPADGTQRRLDRESAALLAPMAFMFFRSFPNRALKLQDLLFFASFGSIADLIWMFAAGACAGLLGLVTPMAMGLLVDHVIPAGQTDQLHQLVMLLVCATFGASAFGLTRAIAAMRINGRAGNRLESAIMDRLMHLPTSFFRDFAAGDLTQRAFGIAGVLQFISSSIQTALLSWIFGIFSLLYLFFISWPLALVASALVAISLLPFMAVTYWRLRLERQIAQAQGDIASRVFQILNGIAKLRACGAEKRAFALWARDFARQKGLAFQSRRIGNALWVFDTIWSILCVMLLYASVAYYFPNMSTGSFLVFMSAFGQFMVSTTAVVHALTGSLSVIPLYERAKPILDALPEVNAIQGAPGELWGAIDLSHVSFRYQPDGPLILNNLSVQIAAGEFVAFVGPSGSGKSTLFRLLLGFEQPQAGAVYFDSKNLTSLDVTAVRRQLGVVLQAGKLMPGDIFTNIVGASPLTLEDAWAAARMAGLADDIEAMPMGMQTVIAEGAGTISGGQRQRLMVARAIVRKPRILLFDEATSALDNRTQSTVAESIAQLNATRIVIAHRLSTVMRADRILYIEGGEVLESGSYAELMGLRGRFFEMAQRQMV